MLKKLTETTAATSLGIAAGHKLLKVSSGNWLNRRAALFMSAPNTIALAWSDSPYSSWSAPQSIATDSQDAVFDATMDSAGNIIVAYSDLSTGHLVTRRLSIGAAGWTVGSKITVYDSAVGGTPNLAISPDGVVWLAWRQYLAPTNVIYVKLSTDGGLVWGSGPTDNGTLISDAAFFIFPRLLCDNSTMYLFVAYGNDKLVYRSRGLAGGDWSSESTIYSGSGAGSEFDVALTDSGGIAVLICDPLPKYREFDGFTWGAISTLDDRPSFSPQLLHKVNNPVALFLSGIGPSQYALMHSARIGGAFTPAEFVDRRARIFDSVLLYHAAGATYQDVTSLAAESDTGDLFHTHSGGMLAGSGDKLYVGLDDRFRYLTILLSTNGAGGTVSYSYWDGSSWKPFTPVAGGSNLTAPINQSALWIDYQGVPKDWQKSVVNGLHYYWVKVECTSAFTTPPVGYQVTAVSDLKQVTARR